MGLGGDDDGILLRAESKYIDPMIRSIIFSQYETLSGLRNYSIEDFLALYEIVYINSTNKAISMEIVKRNMKK